MVNQGKTTLQFNQANAIYNANDRIVFVYGVDTANGANSVAQTSTISVQNLLANSPNLQIVVANLQVSSEQSDPANSTALPSIQQGTMFFSNTFGYIAVANGVLKRWAISTF